MNRLLLALLLASASFLVHGDEPKPSTLQEFLAKLGYVAVPLQRGSLNHLFADGKVNGRKARMLIDTGSPVVAIDPSKTAGMQQLAKIPPKIQAVFGEAWTRESVVGIDKFHIGSLLYEAEPAVVIKLHSKRATTIGSHIPRSGPEGDYDVLWGWEFLSRHHAFLDTSVPALYLRGDDPDTDVATLFGRSLLASGFTQHPLARRGMAVEVTATVNGHPSLFLLDTGSMVTLLDGNQAKDLEVDIGKRVAQMTDLGGNVNTMSLTMVRTFGLGELSLEKIAVGILGLREMNEYRARYGAPPVQGLLGPEVLDRARAIIDCENLRLYLFDRSRLAVRKN